MKDNDGGGASLPGLGVEEEESIEDETRRESWYSPYHL